MTVQLRGDTDKPKGYLIEYEKAFAPIVGKEIKLLELGVAKGGSLLMWRDYFQKGTIVGLDINPAIIDDSTGRIHTYQGYQEDISLLTRIAQEQAPNGFDIIIDDCSHIGEFTRISFLHLFDHHLKSGGIYAIEDWGTGYLSGHVCYPDGRAYRSSAGHGQLLMPGSHLPLGKRIVIAKGPPWLQRLHRNYHHIKRFKSHDYGMVGFIKQLIDECGISDITNPNWGIPPQRSSEISRMLISPGLVIVFKV